eukprot:362269-Chlamydomonas_euryale.AAC.1
MCTCSAASSRSSADATSSSLQCCCMRATTTRCAPAATISPPSPSRAWPSRFARAETATRSTFSFCAARAMPTSARTAPAPASALEPASENVSCHTHRHSS